MNETIRQLFERTSTRAFSNEPVSSEDERLILEAACQAPTAGNQQLYTIIVARDQPVKDALARSCDNQPMISRAPLVLAFCADMRRWARAFEEGGCDPRPVGVGDAALALEDTMIAAQNAVVAAQSLGIGSCYVGDFLENYDEQRRILGLPDLVLPAVLLVLGHPVEGRRPPRKPARFDLSLVVSEDSYRDPSAEELRRAIATKEGVEPDGPEADRRLKAFCERKWNSGFSREMTRSVAQMLSPLATGFDQSDEAGER